MSFIYCKWFSINWIKICDIYIMASFSYIKKGQINLVENFCWENVLIYWSLAMPYSVMNFVNIYWDNGMLPDGTKLLPVPMLTSVCLSNGPGKFLSLFNGVTQYMTLNMIFPKGHKAWILGVPLLLDAVLTITDQWLFERTSALCNPLVRMDQCSYLRVLYTDIAVWILVLPIDIENPYRLSRRWYLYVCIHIHVEYLVSHFSDLSRYISKFTRWAIIEELSIRRRPRTFLITWGQKMCVKYCYVDLLSWCEFWFAIICIDMNVILDFSIAI